MFNIPSSSDSELNVGKATKDGGVSGQEETNQLTYPLDPVTIKILTDLMKSVISTTVITGSASSKASGTSSQIAGRSHGGSNTLLSSSEDGRKVNLATNDYAMGITWDATGFGFVCVTAGHYQVNGGILINSGASSGDILVCVINVNGSTVSSNYFHATNPVTSVTISDIVSLNAGDEVYLYAGDSSGNNVGYNPDSQYTFLSIAYV